MTYPVFATGTLQGVAPSDTQFLLGPALPTVSLADIKQHLRKGSATTDDAELTSYLNTALARIGEICVPTGPATVQDTFDGDGSSVLVLSTFPASAITSVTTYTSSGTAATIAEAGGASGVLDGYRKNLAAGTLTRVGYRTWPRGWGNIVVVYTVGPTPTPADVVLAVKLIVAAWWEARRIAGNLRTPGGTNGDPGDAPDPTFGIPDEAYDLLLSWLKPPRVA